MDNTVQTLKFISSKVWTIDTNMSDSNIGGRKNKNIANHIFIANGIINEVKNEKDMCVDLELLDISKCFDSLWTCEIMNDMYEVMKPNDKLSLMYRENLESHVAIKTPVGKTKRNVVEHIEMQGSVLAPIKTSVQIDTIGKECSQKGDNLYVYKKSVGVPPLSFVDDIAAFAKCGQDSLKLNIFLNRKVEMKKLQLNKEKCKKLHI